MKLIDGEELAEVLRNQKGKNKEIYLDSAFLCDLQEEVEAIPIGWLQSTGMTMINNEARVELFKIINYWRNNHD